MEEILIDDKKYISAKQAAEATGYARDYIGQLCREGRVPARLVGRSWYVLESALHDHRFGNQGAEEASETKQTVPPKTSFTATWESPRYESAPIDILPSIQHRNRIEDAGKSISDNRDSHKETANDLHNSWRSWFDRSSSKGAEHVQEEGKLEKSEEKREEIEKEPTRVPIRAIHERLPEELMPQRQSSPAASQEDTEAEVIRIRKGGGGTARKAVSIFGLLIALALATLAVLGSGYLDSYISGSQVSFVAGITVYHK